MAAALISAAALSPLDLLDPAVPLAALLSAERLRQDARDGLLPAGAVDALTRLVSDDDAMVRAGAVRAISGCSGPATDQALLSALGDPDPGVVERAAWAFSDREIVADAIAPLLALVARGDFAGVLAAAALEHWGAGSGRRLSHEIWIAMASADEPALPRLIELLGLCQDDVAAPLLLSLVHDPGERSAVRAAAATAMGRCASRSVRRVLPVLEAGDADPAVRSAARRARQRLDAPRRVRAQGVGRGLGVAQVMLQGHVDADLTAAGNGDSGGLVTLLVNLAHELADRPGVHRVLTLARDPQGREAGPGGGTEVLGPRSVLVRAEFGPPGPLAAPELWSHRVEIEAELTRLLAAAPDVDVVHLRATDGGTWAAMRVCRALGIPYVFTVAPDPHSVIAAAHRSGELDAESFGARDAAEHWWFRVALLGELVAGASELAVFPRPGGTRRLSRLIGVDLAERSPTVVPEGASLRAPRAAAATLKQIRDGADLPPVLVDLVAAVSSLGIGRQGLPLLVTAGRLHPVKGVDALVAAWAGDPLLRDSFNLVVVGGDLGTPSPVERGVLDAVEAALDRHPQAANGVVLLGARPHAQLALVLAAAQSGLGPAIGADGVYVCASVKEEFGLAIVEALAAGLAVVAPNDGGPPSYIEDGVTGVLVDPTAPGALRAGIARAALLRRVRGRADRAREQIATDVSLSAMAGALVPLYAAALRS